MTTRRRPQPDDSVLDAELDDDVEEEREPLASRARPRTGLKRSVLHAIRQIPSYLRLLFGLFRDGRVSRIDRLLVLGALAYIVSPIDFVPDLIPFFGEVDDLFLLVLALQRLVDNAGRRVVLDHWRGEPDDLDDLNLSRLLSAASFFLPPAIRRRLRRMAR
jgi:uncharacterized membrane protein YkvA (DUF1232 family)